MEFNCVTPCTFEPAVPPSPYDLRWITDEHDFFCDIGFKTMVTTQVEPCFHFEDNKDSNGLQDGEEVSNTHFISTKGGNQIIVSQVRTVKSRVSSPWGYCKASWGLYDFL